MLSKIHIRLLQCMVYFQWNGIVFDYERHACERTRARLSKILKLAREFAIVYRSRSVCHIHSTQSIGVRSILSFLFYYVLLVSSIAHSFTPTRAIYRVLLIHMAAWNMHS